MHILQGLNKGVTFPWTTITLQTPVGLVTASYNVLATHLEMFVRRACTPVLIITHSYTFKKYRRIF